MADTGPFSVNEKVLVPHTDKFYEAKVLKAQKREDGLWYYLLHYTGWNKKWDEWVEETGLRRAPTQSAAAAAPPPAGSSKADAAAAATAALSAVAPAGSAGNGAALPPAAAVGGAAAAGSAPAPAAAAAAAVPKKQIKSTGAVQRQKRPGDAAGETAEPQLELELPAALKKQLLDQYDAMHDDQRIVALPRRPNVSQILQNYVQYVREKQGESQAEEDIAMGLQVYFDKAMYQCLLFKPERQQAQRALAAGQAPSSVYGAEHLLRLFVKLPELLPQTGAAEETLQLLTKRLEDLVAYMQHQAAKIFAPIADYVAAASAAAPAAPAAAAAAAAAQHVSPAGHASWSQPIKQQ